jgi:branched-chain amino acid transport system substrate-binding protein
MVAFANGGSDLTNSVKQAEEFGIAKGGQRLAALAAFITEVHAVGLASAEGLLLTTSFHWDRTEESRQWSKRFFARRGVMPTQAQAGVYSAVTHYLKAVAALGCDEAKAVVAKMRDMPIHDFFADHGQLRVDGRMVHDMYLVEVKKPEESRHPWDYYKIVRPFRARRRSDRSATATARCWLSARRLTATDGHGARTAKKSLPTEGTRGHHVIDHAGLR